MKNDKLGLVMETIRPKTGAGIGGKISYFEATKSSCQRVWLKTTKKSMEITEVVVI